MAKEFDDIFRDAASRFRPEAPLGLWQRISFELDAARGARKLNWVWPLRFAISTIALVTVGLETVRNYDSIALPQPGQLVNYEELAVEMRLLAPEKAMEEKEAEPRIEKRELANEAKISSNQSTARTEEQARSIEMTNAQELIPGPKPATFQKKVLSSGKLTGLTPKANANVPMTVSSKYLLLNPRHVDLKEVPVQHGSRWYIELGGFAESNNLSFNQDYVFSLYDYEDDLFSYVPGEDIRTIQKLSDQRMLNLVAGFKLSEYVHLYSGVRFSSLSGTQTAILNVEEQFAYTITRTYAGPAGFDRIQIEEEVVSATTVRDTISTRFTYNSWSIPLGINLNLPVSKRFSVFVGPQVSLAMGYRFESTSTSKKFMKLNSSIREQENFVPVALSFGAAAGLEYRLTDNFRLSLTGEASKSSFISDKLPKSDEFGTGRLGLGLRYHF